MPIARLTDLNWRRAFAEVALIFIGITLALLFDNWNQDRKERSLERQLLTEVREDLIETRSDLEIDIENSEMRLGRWRDLATAVAEDAPLDTHWASMLGETLDYSVLVAKTSGYRSLTSQGLGILSDPEVRKAITDFYELRLARVALFERRTFPNYNDVYLRYVQGITRIPDDVLVDAVEGGSAPPFVERYELRDPGSLPQDPMLAHLLYRMSFDTRLVLINYYRSLDDIEALIELIGAQLASEN